MLFNEVGLEGDLQWTTMMMRMMMMMMMMMTTDDDVMLARVYECLELYDTRCNFHVILTLSILGTT